MIRLLRRGDEQALEAFLVRHADFSMFLRSNSRAAGLVYEGQPLQAEYVALFDADRIAAVAAHCWNDMLLVQAPIEVAAVARAAVAQSGRPVAGLSGPAEQVTAARTALGLDDRPAPKFGREELFALDLADLVVPRPLADGHWTCRHPRPDELDFLLDWRVDFAREALQFPDSSTRRGECERELALVYERGSNWVLEDGGLVSYSAFNARLPDIVQIGGVWTPRELRGDGAMDGRWSPARSSRWRKPGCGAPSCSRSARMPSGHTSGSGFGLWGNTVSFYSVGNRRRDVRGDA
jgi:hypothetical protein